MIATITFALFVLGVLFFSSISFISIYPKKRKEKICRQLSKEGAANGLVFCSQEILQDKVIGFDGIHRKIMILEKDKNTYKSSIICLDEVHHCQLVSGEETVNPADCKNFSSKMRNGSLELQFQFTNPHQNTSISFANGLVNSKRELALLRAKAQYWCIMFSKMLNPHMSVRA